MKLLTVNILLLVGWVSSTLYCPGTNDLSVGYTGQDVTIVNQGWTISGANSGGAVATRASFNLLGGYVSYTINVGSINNAVNGNIYAIFPSLSSSGFPAGTSSSASPYCDGQGNPAWCPEVDFVETNGHCAGATTLHTVSGTNSNACDAGGCASTYNFPTNTATLNMKVSFSSSGAVSVTLNGASIPGFTENPSSAASVISSYMTSNGAVLYSTLWQGWSPSTSSCNTSTETWGSLSTSSFSISNLQISGSVVKGPTPTVCSGSTPATTTTKAPTTTTKAPSPPATTTKAPSTCNLNTNLAGKQCHGLTQKTLSSNSQSSCQAACCAQSGCKVYQWWGSVNQCWIDTGSIKLTTSNCPASSGNFVSFANAGLTSAENVDSAVQTNYPYIIIGVVVLVVLVGGIYFTLRSKSRKRGQTMGDYVRESVAASPNKPTEHVPLESTPSASLMQETPVAEPAPVSHTTPIEWETRVDETTGQTFYYNNSTGITQWELPDGVVAPTVTAS